MSSFARLAAVMAGAWLALCLAVGPQLAAAAETPRKPATAKSKADAKAKAAAAAKTDAKPDPKAKPGDNRPVVLAGTWSYSRDGDAFLLQFGTPGAQAPSLLATCWPGAGLFQVLAEVSPPKIRSGDAVRLLIGNGKTSVEFAASAFPSVTEGRVAMEAQVKLEPRLVELFKDGEQLRVTVPGAVVLIPLASVKRRIGDFEKACLRARILPEASSAAGG
ncbi:hypothetical protein [Ancylobacter terrae]|uniref:hypothetical protein n=1 Tax=Ancylobacter sp. sgz301288 TaxID=3342077 RepID=UPI00385AB14D